MNNPNSHRVEKYSLQIATEMDAQEAQSIGTTDFDSAAGTFTNISGTPKRLHYFLRSIYNSTASSIIVVYQLFNDTTTQFTARIASGTWFHAYGYIETILAAGTDAVTVTLAYVERNKVNGSGI